MTCAQPLTPPTSRSRYHWPYQHPPPYRGKHPRTYTFTRPARTTNENPKDTARLSRAPGGLSRSDSKLDQTGPHHLALAALLRCHGLRCRHSLYRPLRGRAHKRCLRRHLDIHATAWLGAALPGLIAACSLGRRPRLRSNLENRRPVRRHPCGFRRFEPDLDVGRRHLDAAVSARLPAGQPSPMTPSTRRFFCSEVIAAAETAAGRSMEILGPGTAPPGRSNFPRQLQRRERRSQ
jgi:hypothetical protein